MPSSSQTSSILLTCSLGCGYTVDAETPPSAIACRNKECHRCALKKHLVLHQRKARLFGQGWIFVFFIILILSLAGIAAFGDAIRKALHVGSIAILWAGLPFVLAWIFNYFSLLSRLVAATKFLWAWLRALDLTGLSIRWWPSGGADPQSPAGTGPVVLPGGGSPELLAPSRHFQSPLRFNFHNTRCMGVGDTSIAAAIAYIQFKDWDIKLIDRALADVAKAHEALDSLLRCAAFGSLQIWGITSSDFEWQPLEENYWLEHEIDRLSVLKREKPFTKRIAGGHLAGAHIDLRTSRAQLEATWSA